MKNKNSKFETYHAYTDYDKEPGGLRKLDFIVREIERHKKDKLKTCPEPRLPAGRPCRRIKILDVGCGNGNISLPLASLGFQVSGIDLDKKSVENARRRNKFKNARFEIKDIKDLSKGEKFDFIIASEAIEHLKEPLLFLNFLKNILAREGLIIISIPNGTSLEENIRWFTTHTGLGQWIKKGLKRRVREEKIQTAAESPHLHFFSLSQFKKLLKSAGYEILIMQNSAAIFKEAYYLGLRFFIRRGSKLFHFLDRVDNKISDFIPKPMGDGWTMVVKSREQNNKRTREQ
jgi:ubiquinone biosynthesis O-methyltransferase